MKLMIETPIGRVLSFFGFIIVFALALGVLLPMVIPLISASPVYMSVGSGAAFAILVGFGIHHIKRASLSLFAVAEIAFGTVLGALSIKSLPTEGFLTVLVSLVAASFTIADGFENLAKAITKYVKNILEETKS